MSIDQLGGRLLRGLVQRGALLLGVDGGLIALSEPSGEGIVLVSDPARLAEVLAKHRAGLLHIVLVGGGESDRAELAARWPSWQMSRQLALHHLDENGFYRHVKGPRLPRLEEAAERARDLEPLTAEEMAPLLDATRAAVEEERKFAANAGAPWVSIAIAAACAVIFVLQELWGGSSNLVALVRMGGNRGALDAPWTLIASAFLHGGFGHLALNMAALLSFGPVLERVFGARRYFLLYLVSALGGSLLSAIGHSTPTVSVGASGALWGLMVGGGALVLRPRGHLPPLMAARAKKTLWQPILFNGMYSLQPGIDWLAHLGGGVAGAAVVMLLVARGERPARPLLRSALAVVAVAVVIGSLAIAWAKGRPWELGSPPSMERRFIGVMGLSIEVPKGMGETREVGAVSYGTADHDPVLVEVRYEERGLPLDDEELAAQHAELRKTLATQLPPGVTAVGGVRDESIGELRAVVIDGKYENGVTTRTWAITLRDGMVAVRVYILPGVPDAWQQLRDGFVRSLRTTGGKL